MPTRSDAIDPVRSSRAGHAFHERWAARRALQLIFPADRLHAIAIEGISPTETAMPGQEAEDIADLVLYYGTGSDFLSCERLETVQFKYRERGVPVSASFLKKTIEKFCDTLVGYGREYSAEDVDQKVSFCFVTNAEFSSGLWGAIEALKASSQSGERGATDQVEYLRSLCAAHGQDDPARLFSRIEFRAAERSLGAQSNLLRRSLTDWSAGADTAARSRLLGLQDLILRKAGPAGQSNNLITREDVLDALDCEADDLFPADTRFVDVGKVVERSELAEVASLIRGSQQPVFLHADGGVGKTVFVQSLAANLAGDFEVVVFDCFGGGAYRSEDQARHLPGVGLVQIANELASRGLCDPLLPGDNERIGLIKAARKRFVQAAAAIRDQSQKQGVLIIIDAADNAELEAKFRKQDAFPRLLLASLDGDPLAGVKLMLAARTHRVRDVLSNATVEQFELGSFTDSEAHQFLADRRQPITEIEYAKALARSGRNARVLDYLIDTWNQNILGSAPTTVISVPDIIAQKCAKIIADLRIAGWPDEEVLEFFAALALLPPPIPLAEMAVALSWDVSQIRTAASDLAPMLELTSHGVIFRDEPTETYVHENYSRQVAAQQAIAERLLKAQSVSTYAAEALPHFLVVIGDSDRAFALADSAAFPPTVSSEFGRRRLTLARLKAAFALAVGAGDIDRTLKLAMRLAQAAAANVRGDTFIRRAPALAIMLGEPEAYRRLFNDRSGWRGAKSARLTVANCFAGELDEALIQRESTVRWVSWYWDQEDRAANSNQGGPVAEDIAAIFLQSILSGDYGIADRNLDRWNLRFSLAVGAVLVDLLNQYEHHTGKLVLPALVAFALSDKSKSLGLKLCLLARAHRLNRAQIRTLSRSARSMPSPTERAYDEVYGTERLPDIDVLRAAFGALSFSSRLAAARILSTSVSTRPSTYYYGERYGPSKAWSPILRACLGAWSSGRHVHYRDLLPSEVTITRDARSIVDKKQLVAFLSRLETPPREGTPRRRKRGRPAPRFNERDRSEIASGIELVLNVARPVGEAVLKGRGIPSQVIGTFLSGWRTWLREGIHRSAETPTDLLSRTIGAGFVRLLLKYADDVSEADAEDLVSIVSNDRFYVGQKTAILALFAERPSLHDVAGRFAKHIADQIVKDDSVEQRGEHYSDLAAALVPMSLNEARVYYREGLAQLDQMGGEDHDRIYALLHYASVQRGGLLRPELAQRLMNLCQTIANGNSDRFGWTLFGRAAAQSIGIAASHKILRWDDQDVTEFSYGLPQLACFLAKAGRLDARRAAFIMTICKDHGWNDWQVGKGLEDLLAAAPAEHRRPILVAVLSKLKAEHPLGAWPSLWESLLSVGETFPGALSAEDQAVLAGLRDDAKRKQDEFNGRSSSEDRSIALSAGAKATKRPKRSIKRLLNECDPSSVQAIDHALGLIYADGALPYHAGKSFLDGLATKCSYDQRLAFLIALCESSRLEFDRTIDRIIEYAATWSDSATHLEANSKQIIQSLFETKGSELFELRSSNIAGYIATLADFCGDARFVLDQVLATVVREGLELDGDDWLQLATSLCQEASPQAGLEALETVLSGPSSRLADEIGEGPHRPAFAVPVSEAEYLAGIIWHLLGDSDSYIRWNVARALPLLASLGLKDELELLFDGLDRKEIPSLASEGTRLSFQNAQQWLLIGIARAALLHGPALAHLRPRLLALAERPDIHLLHKRQIARCIQNLGGGDADPDTALREGIERPQRGYVEKVGWPPPAESKSGFSFDYEFNKTEIGRLAGLFGIARETAVDAVAAEITRLWPDATSLDYFGGRDRYERYGEDRYEFFREHVQRHALLSAATQLAKSHPVLRHYDGARSAWGDWFRRYDLTFDDGAWLADRKDDVPPSAKTHLLGRRIDRQETLRDQRTLFETIGLWGAASHDFVPLYSHWTSSDGVHVRVVSALSGPKGVIGRCASFSKRDEHDLWLPVFDEEGRFDRRGSDESDFDPLVWAPTAYYLGIDTGDELSARGPALRPQLGLAMTEQLGLAAVPKTGRWLTADGVIAMRSQVWGSLRASEDGRSQHHNDGEILWAQRSWLDAALSKLSKRLVYSIKLSKYRSTQPYDETSGVSAAYIGLRSGDADVRIWRAKRGSHREY